MRFSKTSMLVAGLAAAAMMTAQKAEAQCYSTYSTYSGYYAAPAPVFIAPAPVYVAPRPVYVAPAPVYMSRPVYVSRPVYSAPVYRTRSYRAVYTGGHGRHYRPSHYSRHHSGGRSVSFGFSYRH